MTQIILIIIIFYSSGTQRQVEAVKRLLQESAELRRMKSQQGAKIIKRPKYEHLLTFLNALLRNEVRGGHSSADNPDSSNDESSMFEEAVGPAAFAASPCPAPEPADCAWAAPLAPRRHKITDFFMGLIETVRDLPDDVQIRVKRDVFKVVSDAEELVYKSRTETLLSRLDFVKEET